MAASGPEIDCVPVTANGHEPSLIGTRQFSRQRTLDEGTSFRVRSAQASWPSLLNVDPATVPFRRELPGRIQRVYFQVPVQYFGGLSTKIA